MLLSLDPHMETVDVYVGVVEFNHPVGGDEFIGVSEAVDRGFEFFDDVVDGLVVF